MFFKKNYLQGVIVLSNSILLVEDHPMMNELLAKAISQKIRVDVHVAFNGKQALEAYYSVRFSLILMDKIMPVMNGYEAISQIRLQEKASGDHIPIISMTANSLEMNPLLYLADGIDDYIIKPFRIDELLDKINYWLTIGHASALPITPIR
jgi:CheY-like chemotaxis protein